MRAILPLVLSSLLLLCSMMQVLAAETYPQRSIRMVVAAPPGGSADTVARIVAQKLRDSDALGQQVVVDNRPGGGQIIATAIGAQAAPDGYTLLVVASAFTSNPSLRPKKLPYDTQKDFSPVTQLWSAPNLLVAGPSLPVGSVKELIAYAKSNPGKVNYGSAGTGLSNHLAGEMLRTMAGIDIVHVPYKGARQRNLWVDFTDP